jgi:hypothetical protein
MDYTFKDLIGKIIEIYQDDLTMFSKDRKDHVKQLKQIFDICRRFGISLNPKKSVFGVDEGKFLGHIISKEGVKVDPSKIEAIEKIPLPETKKVVQCFFGKINFFRRFIPNFVEITKPISNLLKKYREFKGDDQVELPLEDQDAISMAPVLVSPDYSRDFLVFSFASEETIVGVLLQKNENNQEQPIAFMSQALRDLELKYKTMEKASLCLSSIIETL